jgi:hypothetical protein
MWNRLQDCSRVPEQIEEVFEDSFDNKHLHPSMKPFMDYLTHDGVDASPALLEMLQDFPQRYSDVIFMQAMTPVRSYHGPSGWSSGWGHCYTCWVAAPTFTEAWALLVKWAREMHGKDMAKAIAEGKCNTPKGTQP